MTRNQSKGSRIPFILLLIALIVPTVGFTVVNLRWYEQKLEDQIRSLEQQTNERENSSAKKYKISDAEYLSLRKDIAELRKEQYSLHTNLYLITVQIISGLAVFGGFYFTWQSQKNSNERANKDFNLAEKRLIDERFGKSVEQLGNNKCVTRLGGMYSLHSIAIEHPGDFCNKSLNILAAFIQDRCSQIESSIPDDEDGSRIAGSISDGEDGARIPTDIQTCFGMIGELTKTTKEITSQTEDITDQKRDYLSEINLRSTNLTRLQIKHKEFHLMMEFSFASIKKTEFIGTKFLDARFISSKLTEVNFDYAVINLSSFREATIEKVSFKQAKLKSTSFEQSKIQDTNFEGADLSQASFEDTTLTKVYFKGAKLEKTKFKNVDLRSTDITEQQLEVVLLCNTTMPDGSINNRNCKEIEGTQKTLPVL